jgi:hypothetical protein
MSSEANVESAVASRKAKRSAPKRAKRSIKKRTVKRAGGTKPKANPKGKQGKRADGKPRAKIGSRPPVSDKAVARGMRLRAKRVALGLGQSFVAGRARIGQGYLSNIETGVNVPTKAILARICKVLGLKAA